MMEEKHIRLNFNAIAAAAIASVVLLGIWYEFFLDTWLKGIGHDRFWLANTGVSDVLQCLTAVLAAVLLAATISAFTQLTGEQTAARGSRVGFGIWLSVLATHAIANVFEARSYTLFALNSGFWLLAMVAMGAIVGGWPKKQR